MSHPSEEPRRGQTSVLVFHMADMDSCDASYVSCFSLRPHYIIFLVLRPCFVYCSAIQIFHELFTTYQDRGIGVFVTHLRSGPRVLWEKAGIVKLLGPDVFYDNLSDAMAKVEGR